MDVSFLTTIFSDALPIAPELIVIVGALIAPLFYFITKDGKRCYNLGRPRGTTLEGLAEKSAQKRAELAEMSHENTAIWEMCKQYRIDGKNPTKANYEAVAETLKKMGIKSPSGMELNGKRVCSAYFTILDRKQRLGLIDKDGKEVAL